MTKDYPDQILNLKYGIYCRSANYSEEAIEHQKQVNLAKLKERENINEEDVVYYIDNGFPSVKELPPSMKQLLEDIKDGTVNVVYVYELNRISRDILKIYEVKEILDCSDADFFVVLSNEYLNRGILNNSPYKYFKPDKEPEMEME